MEPEQAAKKNIEKTLSDAFDCTEGGKMGSHGSTVSLQGTFSSASVFNYVIWADDEASLPRVCSRYPEN